MSRATYSGGDEQSLPLQGSTKYGFKIASQARDRNLLICLRLRPLPSNRYTAAGPRRTSRVTLDASNIMDLSAGALPTRPGGKRLADTETLYKATYPLTLSRQRPA